MSSREERRWRRQESTKKIQKAHKEIGRHREPDRLRRKSRHSDHFDDEIFDELDYSEIDRKSRHARKQRRPGKAIDDLDELAEIEELPALPGPAGRPGVVKEIQHNGLCRIEVAGSSLLCRVRGSLNSEASGFTNAIAVGDEVLVVTDNGSGQGLVKSIRPRRSLLVRPDATAQPRQELLVANADQFLIVISWREPAIQFEFLDRCLIAAARNQLAPIICLNKIDLAGSEAAYRAPLQFYEDLGYDVFHTSILSGYGLIGLRQVLRGQTTIVTGPAGVGLSSLLAAVQPGWQPPSLSGQKSPAPEQNNLKALTLYPLEIGGFVVQVPNLHQFGLNGLPRQELAGFYPEMAAVAENCRLSRCTHISEPDCAVKTAVEQDCIATTRYETYRKIFATLPA